MTAVTALAAVMMSVVLVTVVVAVGLLAVFERARQQGPDGIVRAPGYAAAELDPSMGQCLLCAAADAAADERIHSQVGKKARSAPWPLPAVSTTCSAVICPFSTS